MRKRLTMLIVDDVEVNRVTLRQIFQEEYDIVEAEDGLEALKMLMESKIDIVILDLFMPNLDGKSVLSQMKEDEDLKHIPVVVKTAIDEGMEVEVLEAGADDFIFSPCNPAVVRNRVNNIVNKYIYEREIMQRQIEKEKHTSNVREAFIERMSHELRTPVNSILGISELSKENGDNPEKMREAFEKIKAQSEYMVSLLNDALDISAIDRDEILIHESSFQLSSIVSSVSEHFYNECRKKGINFTFELKDVTYEFLMGDAVRIKQIWLNLLSNAYKYTRPGGSIQTTFREQQMDAARVMFEFSVRDSGCGISMEHTKAIWTSDEYDVAREPFPEMGYTLGLSITKKIVEIMNGSICVESQPGKGSVFTVRIPMKIGKETVEERKSFHSMHALIVGDEEISCAYYKAILARLGLHHEAVYNMKEALDDLNTAYQSGDGYNLCFVNWHMPEGKKLIETIRKIFDKDTLTIIGASYDAELLEKDMKQAGVDYVLSKPIFQSTIYNLMTEICRQMPDTGKVIKNHYDFEGKHVMVVEDNAINAEIMMDYLKYVHVTCDWVKNGKAAVEMFEHADKPYDAILMDISMPVMDGYEASGAIRKLKDGAYIPIIAVTANAFASDIIEIYEAGMNAHIIKPVELEVLCQTLNQFLG